MPKILIAYPRKFVLDVKDMVEAGLYGRGYQAVIHTVYDQKSGEAILRLQDLDLVISHLHIPRDHSLSVNLEDECGIALLRMRKPAPTPVPAILVGSPDQELLLPNCRMVMEGELFEEQLIQTCVDSLDARQQRRQKGLVDLFYLDKSMWYFEIEGDAQTLYRAKDVLKIDVEKMNDLARRSRTIGNRGVEWEDELRSIGIALGQELINDNPLFAEHLHKLQQFLRNEPCAITFRFNVEKKVHPILFEAILEKEDDQFLMLSSPNYRRVKMCGDTHACPGSLREFQGKLNCLIIEADAQGYQESIIMRNGEHLHLQPLRHISEEVKKVESSFRKCKASSMKFDKILKISKDDDRLPFRRRLQEVMESETWHVVHYCGHSYYDDLKKKGFVFVPGEDFRSDLDIDLFGHWLRKAKTRLIYLSSCESTHENIVLDLVKYGVPGLIGFRWGVRDRVAAEHAEIFYRNFLEEEYELERAFLRTRKWMHKKHREDTVWAAAMLIRQN